MVEDQLWLPVVDWVSLDLDEVQVVDPVPGAFGFLKQRDGEFDDFDWLTDFHL